MYNTLIPFLYLLALGANVLMGLATYNDAKSRMNDSAAMWGVLVGLFFWIPGIIYLCTRNNAMNRMIMCRNCGWGLPMSYGRCPRCGAPNPYSQYLYSPQARQYRDRAKVMLIIAIVLYVAVVVLGIVTAASAASMSYRYDYSFLY